MDSEYPEVLRGVGLAGFVIFLGYYVVPLYLIAKDLRNVRLTPSAHHSDPYSLEAALN